MCIVHATIFPSKFKEKPCLLSMFSLLVGEISWTGSFVLGQVCLYMCVCFGVCVCVCSMCSMPECEVSQAGIPLHSENPRFAVESQNLAKAKPGPTIVEPQHQISWLL